MRPTAPTLTVVFLVLGASCAPLAAQEVRRVSLEEAVALFHEHGLPLRIARAERAAAVGEARQARAYPNPRATSTREELDRADAAYWEQVIGLEQRIEWPGRTAARFRAADRRVDAARARFRADSVRLTFAVRRAYAEAWGEEQTLAALERAAGPIRQAAGAAERRYGEGDISGYRLRRLQLERARLEQALAEARLDAAAARRRLATLVLLDEAGGQLGPADPLTGRPPPIELEAALVMGGERFDLEAAAREAEATRAEGRAASLDWIPDPTLSAGYKDQSDGFSGLALGVALPLPLFDRGGGAAAAAEARHDAALARLELRRREARDDVLAAHERYAAARERLEAWGEGLADRSAAVLESARVAYEEGEMSLIELLDAAEAYRAARVLAVELRAGIWIAYFDLLRAMGATEVERTRRSR